MAYRHHLASATLVTMGLVNGLSPVQYQAITRTRDGLMSIRPYKQSVMEFESKMWNKFIKQKVFQNVVCIMTAILFKTQLITKISSRSTFWPQNQFNWAVFDQHSIKVGRWNPEPNTRNVHIWKGLEPFVPAWSIYKFVNTVSCAQPRICWNISGTWPVQHTKWIITCGLTYVPDFIIQLTVLFHNCTKVYVVSIT